MLFSPIVPFEDEHLTSIIERLSIYLGYEQLSIFCRSIYRPDLKHYDYFPIHHPLLKIFDLLGPCDYSEIILKHTEYSFLAPLSYKLDSLKFISAMFDLAGVSFKSRTQKIKRCPECDKEKSYVRRTHNLPGVTVCYKHKCSLVVDGDEINAHITQHDIKYAIYAKEFAEACFDFSWTDINKYIEINTTTIKTKSLSQKLEMVMNVFPSVSDISIITNTPSIKTNEYDVLYSSNNLVELICKKCGRHFCTTSLGYSIDFLCPVCQKAFTDEELNENRFMKVTKGKFKQISGSIFSNAGSKVLHEDCMILYYVDNCTFVENPVCRCCERKETSSFKNLLPGYKILAVINHKYILQNETNKEKLSMYTCEVNKLSVKLNAKKTRWTLDEMSSEITRLGYKCLSSYSFDDEMKLLCKRGHISNRTFSSLRQSPECSKCCKLQRLKSSSVLGRISFHFRSEEIFSLEDAKNLLINKKASNTFKELVDEKFIHSLAPGYYSLKIEKLSGEEIVDKYYINGYRHHGFYVSYTFWEKLEEIDIPKKDCIFACTSAVEEKKITFVNKQKFQLMPFPEYYSDDRKLETQLVFSLNNVKYPPKTMEKIIELARFYVKNNSLDKKFINKYSKVKLYEKKIRKNKKKT